ACIRAVNRGILTSTNNFLAKGTVLVPVTSESGAVTELYTWRGFCAAFWVANEEPRYARTQQNRHDENFLQRFLDHRSACAVRGNELGADRNGFHHRNRLRQDWRGGSAC